MEAEDDEEHLVDEDMGDPGEARVIARERRMLEKERYLSYND